MVSGFQLCHLLSQDLFIPHMGVRHLLDVAAGKVAHAVAPWLLIMDQLTSIKVWVIATQGYQLFIVPMQRH